MTMTGHFLGGVDMLKLFHTARFIFGLLAVLSLLLLPSLSPYRTMASSSFLDPPSADEADDDHGGSSSSPGDADESITGPPPPPPTPTALAPSRPRFRITTN